MYTSRLRDILGTDVKTAPDVPNGTLLARYDGLYTRERNWMVGYHTEMPNHHEVTLNTTRGRNGAQLRFTHAVVTVDMWVKKCVSVSCLQWQ